MLQLKAAFGAVELRRFPDAAGKIMHAEVSYSFEKESK